MKITSLEEIKNMMPRIPEDAHKYTRGRLFMVCGSYGMAGAAIMAARAALRTGVGFLDLALPSRIYSIVTSSVPEAVCSVYDEKDPDNMEEVLRSGCEKADAVVVGCGLGTIRDMVCPPVVYSSRKPVLIDADGLNWLAEYPETDFLSDDVVLTPHEGELARLLSERVSDIHSDRAGKALLTAEEYHATVLLKGPGTLIVKTGEEIYKNPTGNAGMARAGSGDVLSGIIGSLMAQGMSGYDAAIAGAFIHGMAGDHAKEVSGIRSMTPTDLINSLTETIKNIDS